MAAENKNSQRLAIVKVPLKLAASLIFDEKNRSQISAKIVYRGKFVDFENCEILDFLYDWNSQTLDFRISSPEFDKIMEFGQAKFCELKIENLQNAGEISPNLKTANSDLENSAAENIRQQKAEMEIESAVEKVAERFGITESEKLAKIRLAKEIAADLKREKQGENYQEWLEYARQHLHEEIATAIINFAENSSNDERAGIEKTKLPASFKIMEIKNEPPSDQPEFLKRES